MTPEEVRTEWVRRLRSGDYEQTTARLKRYEDDNVSYCCLGVLCELAVENGIIKEGDTEVRQLGEVAVFGSPTEASSAKLPSEVAEWAGLKSSVGRFINERGSYRSLTELNDGGKKFSEIADIIESEPAEMFQ